MYKKYISGNTLSEPGIFTKYLRNTKQIQFETKIIRTLYTCKIRDKWDAEVDRNLLCISIYPELVRVFLRAFYVHILMNIVHRSIDNRLLAKLYRVHAYK